jgi:hypothetical protein
MMRFFVINKVIQEEGLHNNMAISLLPAPFYFLKIGYGYDDVGCIILGHRRKCNWSKVFFTIIACSYVCAIKIKWPSLITLKQMIINCTYFFALAICRLSWQITQLKITLATNPHWARVVGYDPVSLWVIHKEGLCLSSGDINRLVMMMMKGNFYLNIYFL